MDRLLSLREAAAVLGVSVRGVYRLVQREPGFPQMVHCGASSRVLSSELAAYIERLKRERGR